VSRVVLVIGASSGIGRVTAVACSRRGDSVVLAARSEEGLRATEKECAAATLVVPTDVTDAAAVDALFAAAVAEFGRVDAVVHTAAVIAYGRFEDVPAEVFDRAIATTFTGTATVSRAALRLFKAQGGGSLVLVGSLLGRIATPYMSSYVAAKWAVHGLARVLWIEARETPGVHVSMVAPGAVDTPVYQQAGSYLGRGGRPPPPVDPPERVARAIIRAIDHPRRHVSVGLANPIAALGFRLLPGVYDVLVGPLLRVAGISRREVPPNAGNVEEANPALEAPTGGWTRQRTRGRL
jgi:NAD(P)-dependent dehydrogenase (short-subunit alcohol dehydrogenase family)